MFRYAKKLRELTDEVILFFSGGKDAIVSLSVLHKQGFKKIIPVFMYLAPGLRINEEILQWYENKFQLEIMRIPHFDLDSWNVWFYTNPGQTKKKDRLSLSDMYKVVRGKTSVDWITLGMRVSDSMTRRGFIKNKEVNDKQKIAYPIAHWIDVHIYKYIKMEKLKLPDQYKLGLRDICGFTPETVGYIINNYPDDWEKLIKYQPAFDRYRIKYGY